MQGEKQEAVTSFLFLRSDDPASLSWGFGSSGHTLLAAETATVSHHAQLEFLFQLKLSNIGNYLFSVIFLFDTFYFECLPLQLEEI